LQDLAGLLDAKAAEVEQAQRDRAARIAELRREWAAQQSMARVS
jgi:hypothetical protein